MNPIVANLTALELIGAKSNNIFALLKKSTMISKRSAAMAAFLIALISNTAFSQDFTWAPLAPQVAKSANEEVSIQAERASFFNFEYAESRSEFSDTFTMEIPLADGTFSTFLLEENNTMSLGLKEKFPEIKSFNAIAIDGSGYLGKVDFTSKGFHAMLLHPAENTQFVDPLYLSESSTHIAYQKKDFTTTKEMNCEADFDLKGDGLGDPKSGINYNSCVLRTYRIAIAATGEYTIFQGGSVAEALAAQVTTMNRVNGIYERDFGVTMTLVPNNDEIIYTNPNTDPFSNGETFAMINENPPVINAVIGFSNYDIGHVFGTNSGGLAGFGVTCESNKAAGVTGNNSPIGDPFDVDYVAHEIGHQFGGSHTFNNSCNGNRSNSTAVEPGSGSTIMAYAGICNPNVQNNSDDHFHGVSMRQIGTRINSDNCPVITGLDNLAPVLDSVVTDFFVPSLTPFALTAYAFDLDEDDVLTYNFEQIDNEISEQPPLANATEGPNFRSFSPTTNPTQYFPRLETLTSSGSNQWQVLSSVDRSMSFRCSVKDNSEGGGCAQYEDLEFEVVSSAGPFFVTNPTQSGITWEAFTSEVVTWDVANTNSPPINADLVNIFLSVDGGITYPFTLAEDVANNGATSVVVPNAPTADARVMVMNTAGTFFDISNSDFTIIGLTSGFLILADDTTKSACVGDDLTFVISVEGIGGFNEMITLSLEGDLAGIDAILADNTIMVGESTALTISGTEGIETGVLDIIINGSAISFEQSLTVEAGFNSIVPEVPTLSFPEDGAEFVPTDLILDWESSDSPDAFYTIEVSTDAAFTADVLTFVSAETSQVNTAGLSPSTVYYWRVRKETTCSDGDFSEAFSFGTHSCFSFESEDVPVNLSVIAGVFTSTLEIPFEGTVQDLNVININGTHGNTGQLKVSLVSPSGVEVNLIEEICDNTQNFNLGFDDSSGLEEIECPATTGFTYQPSDALSAFIGENTQGLWTLVITDNVSGGGGFLNNWSIEVCIANAGSFILTKDEDISQVCQGQSTAFDVTAEEVFAFGNAVVLTAENVPSGMTVNFAPNIINTGQSSEVTITADSELTASAYLITVIGTSGELTDELDHSVEVNLDNAETIELLSPPSGAIISTLGFFEWEPSISPSTLYTLELATDDLFTNVVESIGSLSETEFIIEELLPSQTLFWRVIADNGCVSSSSFIRSFSTLACASSEATDGLPLSISPVAGIFSSELEIVQAGVIQSISIPNIGGTHFRVSDLIVSLESPSGTEVVLFSNICAEEQDFNLGFLEGANGEIDCPAITGGLYSPAESLSAFAGEDALGTWTLKLNDIQNGGGGQLNNWSLLICYEGNVSATDIIQVPEFSIFPNPTNDFITVTSKEGNIDELLIFDISGRILDRIQVKGNTNVTFDFSEYAKGGYLIEISGPFGTATKKVIRK